MAGPVLEAFIKLFADDTRLRQQMGALKVEAERAGADISKAFTTGSARGAAPAQGELFGGAAGARGPEMLQLELFKAEKPNVEALGKSFDLLGASLRRGKKEQEDYGIGVRDAAGSIKLLGTNLLGEFNPALGASADIALNAARNLKGLGVGLAASGAAAGIAALAIGLYVKSVREGIDATVKLAQAQERGDFGAVAAQANATADELVKLRVEGQLATQQINSLHDASEVIVSFWSGAFGPSADKLTERLEKQRMVAEDLWKAFEAPKLAIEGMKRSATELEAMGQASQKAAEDTISLSAATDMLVKAKEKAADAEKRALDLADERLRKDARMGSAERDARLAENQQKRVAIENQLARDLTAINDNRRRQLGEMEALEVEHTAKMVSLAQQRHEAIVQTLGQIVETEAATTLSLEQTYRARAALLTESTQNAINALETESKARRAALEKRIGGATGQERVKLERELTAVIEEETTKRTALEGRHIADSLRLFRQAQQEKIALQERVFAIQRTLGERSLHDDLARQTAIARGAEAGSQTQLRALEQVAQSVRALSDQAKQFLSSALSAADEVARKAGREAPAMVSRESLAQAGAERLTQLEEAERTFARGGEITREAAQALSGGELTRLQEQREAGIKSLAATFGRTGTPVPQFGAGVTQAAFGEQINVAFEKPMDAFTNQVGPQFASMVSKAAPHFEEMTNLWGKAVDQMVQKAEDGSSKMGAALYENFKTRLVRDLEREVKTF